MIWLGTLWSSDVAVGEVHVLAHVAHDLCLSIRVLVGIGSIASDVDGW